MPDFLPTPQMPQGLAEETLRLAAARGEASPWAALAKAAGQVGQGMAAKRAMVGPMLSPEDQVRMGLLDRTPAPGPAQPGQPSPTMGGPMFARPIPQSLAENILQRKTQEDQAREATTRILGAAGIKANVEQIKDHTPATADMLKNYPKVTKMGFQVGDLVPNRFLGEEMKPSPAPKAGGAGSGLQVDKFVQGEMDKAARMIDPTIAPRGSPLGNAGMMKVRVATAREALSDPQITPQQLNAVATDLAGIVQMGTPHEIGIKDQNYQTWWTKAKALSGRITNKPETADSPETVKKMREILDGYDKVYNKVINANLDTYKKSLAPMMKKYPDLKNAFEAAEKQLREQYPAEDVKTGAGDVSAHDALIDKYLLGK